MLSQVRVCVSGAVSRVSLGTVFKRWCSASHTLSVKTNIEKTREQALQGGGQDRIDKQHQKVEPPNT